MRSLKGKYRTLRDIQSRYGFFSGLHRALGVQYTELVDTPGGENLLSRDWDVLILLDACRFDRFGIVREAVPTIGRVQPMDSVASCTWKWMEETFCGQPSEELERITYISANPHSDKLPDEIGDCEPVWEYAWDDDIGTVPPRAVTDAAISHARCEEFDRLIIHYLQPHAPFLSDPTLAEGSSHFSVDSRTGRGTWHDVQSGRIDAGRAISAYENDLDLVTDELALILNNLEAETVAVSADHGEAFGERGVYGHPPGVPLPSLIEVPYVEVEAEDRQTHSPTSDQTADSIDRREKLEALGYL